MGNVIVYGFTGNCYIKELNKLAHNVKKGDIIGNSEVLCIIKTKFENGGLCEIGNNNEYISMYHPILYNNKWMCVKDLYDVEMLNSEERDNIGYLYNFVLSDNHTLTINDVVCAMPGHNFKDEIVNHPFFGNRKKFIDCIRYLPGYDTGIILLTESDYLRDENGVIVNIKI
jgi:hypothetical protein